MTSAGRQGNVPTPTADLVIRLLEEQAPRLAHRAVRPSIAEGSSNWVFRLGDDLAARLPRSTDYCQPLLNEVAWLPRIGPHLSVPVPAVELVGQPSPTFPRPWAVVTWIDGDRPTPLGDTAQQERLATDLGAFCRELHRVDSFGQAPDPERWGYRCGEPVTPMLDGWADRAADRLADLFDPTAVREAWSRIRDVPPATRPPSWVHTDLSTENLLVGAEGHLTGVIDFGDLGIGDPAIDLVYAWSMFDPAARDTLRAAAEADEATWLRARAFAFVGPGLVTLVNYRQHMPDRAHRLTTMLRSIAADVEIDLSSHT